MKVGDKIKMAHSKQAKKRIVQSAKRQDANKTVRTYARTCMKNVDKAVEANDKALMASTFTAAMAALHKAVSKNIFKKNFAARNITKMAAKIRKANEAA
mgnify:CR=1 FL=1